MDANEEGLKCENSKMLSHECLYWSSRKGSRGWNLKPGNTGFENSIERMQVKKVRRVRIR